MMYSGLIISHNGCLKINDAIDNKVNPSKFTLDKEGYNKSLVFTYCDDDVYEVGEVSATNCKNEYPYAMAYKRCFDRVVLKKSQLAYSGVYSDSEAEEFQKDGDKEIEELKITKIQENTLLAIIKDKNIPTEKVVEILQKRGVKKLRDLKVKNFVEVCEELKA